MKKKYFLIAAMTLSGGLMAQPVLNEGNNAPEVGESFMLGSISWDGTAPTEGEDQVWDYSSLTAGGSVSTNIYAPTECDAYAEFPEANITTTNDDMNYGFSEVSSEGILNYGYYASSVVIYYSNPEQQMVYPFAFGDNFSDDFHSTFESGITWNRGGATTVSAVGYGTLELPEATLENVMLVKMEQDYGDSAMGDEIYHYYTTIYQFFREGVSYPVLNFTSYTIEGSSPSYSGAFMGDPTLFVPEEELEFTVYPNPAQNNLNIQCAQFDQVESIEVRSISGQTIYRSDIPVNTIDVADWEHGVYLLEVTTENGRVTKKIVKS